ncbi:hypothetical protein DM01DRAFT_1046340 [Hesseltinella vesiculosa]|uniref:Uncharacterized protein n=1 Tax=Hesseltinella vesiculosa TaxID=101127 RepID=A0A1X2GH10_9FUNG|nr:hypothetical protein DM01DRAFT_1046340 [Hesseltinella vesiculosa]
MFLAIHVQDIIHVLKKAFNVIAVCVTGGSSCRWQCCFPCFEGHWRLVHVDHRCSFSLLSFDASGLCPGLRLYFLASHTADWCVAKSCCHSDAASGVYSGDLEFVQSVTEVAHICDINFRALHRRVHHDKAIIEGTAIGGQAREDGQRGSWGNQGVRAFVKKKKAK